jgi:hypothetical protein
LIVGHLNQSLPHSIDAVCNFAHRFSLSKSFPYF